MTGTVASIINKMPTKPKYVGSCGIYILFSSRYSTGPLEVACLLAGLLAGLFDCWLAGLLVDWLACLLAGLLGGWLACLPACWLACLLAGLLTALLAELRPKTEGLRPKDYDGRPKAQHRKPKYINLRHLSGEVSRVQQQKDQDETLKKTIG